MRLLATAILFAACCAAADKAQFTKDGALVAPSDYREWIFLSSGLGMTYGPNAPAPGAPLRFDNVYVNPSSYREFLRTGAWPDGTMLVLEIRDSESKGSINRHGRYQTARAAVEANVKDSRRFGGNGWAFFDLTPSLDGKQPAAKRIPSPNRCEQCHSAHGAVDNTFVQFYPELIPVAKKHGTYRESAASAAGH
jgi:hypothetical protein